MASIEYPLHLDQIVAGGWRKAQVEDRIEITAPCDTSRVLGSVPAATGDLWTQAADAAAEALGPWRKLPARDRAEKLSTGADRLDEAAVRIGRVAADELGRPVHEAEGEVHAAARQLRYYAQEAIRWRGGIAQSDHEHEQVLILDRPVGVVLVISPWNNPLFLWSRFAAPALAAGCTVVAKPPSEGPLSTLLMAEVLVESGWPAGVLNVVTGRGAQVSETLLGHPAVRKAALTGGVDAGRRLMAEAARHLKPTALELGGQCPAIVCEDAQLETAADAISFQAFRQGGQVCNRVNRTYVHESVYDQVVAMLRQRISRIKVGLVDDPEAAYAALINQKQLEQTQRHVEDGLARGARLQAGGSRLSDPPFDRGWFFAPTLLSDCPDDALVMREETFGPVLAVAPYREFDRVIEQANDTPYGLSSFLFTRDAGRAHYAMHELEAGSIWINDIHLSYPQCPYGGCKASGVGRTQGIEVMREFLEPTTVYWDFADYRRGVRSTGH